MLLRLLLVSAVAASPVLADKPGKPGKGGHDRPKHAHKHNGVPPGLAKKGGLPPGLAKKFGPRRPDRPYIAFDPRYDDRAWFLIDGRWVLREGLTGSLRLEVRDSLRLPIAPPPVPLPKVGVDLRVVLFD